MIVASLILVVVAGGLLVVGVVGGGSTWLAGSIGVSVAAGVALIVGVRQQRRTSDADRDPADREPVGEPPTEDTTAEAIRALAASALEVVVVDGRPRFHLPDCPSVVESTAERLPAAEAVELGFTPCGGCRPSTAMRRGRAGAARRSMRSVRRVPAKRRGIRGRRARPQ